MGFPSVKSFFGLDLSTGTFIIAGISLGGNIVCLLFFIYTLVAGLRLMVVNYEEYEEGMKPVVITVSWSLGVALAIMGITTSSLLIHGIRTKSWVYFVFWLVWDSLCLTYNLFIFIANLTEVFASTESHLGPHQAYLIVGNVAGLVVTIYFWVVVNSRRREIRIGQRDDDQDSLVSCEG